MDDLKNIDVKIFVKDAGGIQCHEFMGVFQRWIQDHTISGVLIDAADYCHMHHGPGVVLVAHEFNVSIDYVDGRMGLLFHYRRPAETTFDERLQSALKQAFNACKLLEEDETLKGRLVFDPSGFQFMAGDRLRAPNDEAAFESLKPLVEQAAAKVYGGDVSAERMPGDARDRLTMHVTATATADLAALG